MKVRDTSQGRMYAISSEIGCTALNGAMAVDIPAGGQSVILALDKKIVIDGDDDAKFVEVRWGTNTAVGSRPVPPWISDVLAGLISITGDDTFDFNYMPAENKLVVHTDRVDDIQYAEVTGMLERFVPDNIEVEYYNHNMEISWRDINKYAACTTLREMEAVDPNFMNDVTSEGEWIYPLPEMVDMSGATYHANDGLQFYSPVWQSDKLKKWSVDLPKVQAIGYCWQYSKNLIEMNAKMPMLPAVATGIKIVAHFNPNGLRKFSSDWNHIVVLYQPLHAAYDLTEAYLELSSLYGADIGFGGSKLNKESSLRILNSLPDSAYCDYVETVYSQAKVPRGYRQKLTIGIGVSLQNDEVVWAAIHNAESRGWKLKVQWNPGGPTYTTPEASTFNMGMLIYAKVDEMELPDGTTEQYLDWGHYVTDPTGYETFRSLESAYEYFGLEMPEVETESPAEE